MANMLATFIDYGQFFNIVLEKNLFLFKYFSSDDDLRLFSYIASFLQKLPSGNIMQKSCRWQVDKNAYRRKKVDIYTATPVRITSR